MTKQLEILPDILRYFKECMDEYHAIQGVLEAFKHMGASPDQLKQEKQKLYADGSYLRDWAEFITMEVEEEGRELLDMCEGY